MIYILDNNNNVLQCDLKTWLEWMSGDKRKIKHSFIQNLLISTVFIGTGLMESTPMFETMIFENEEVIWEKRSRTYNEALEDHKDAIIFASTLIYINDSIVIKEENLDETNKNITYI